MAPGLPDGAIAFAGHFLGSWVVTSTPQCHCTCDCSATPDADILQLLRNQLDRCGPAQLGPAASLGWGKEVALWCFVVGIILGACLGLAAAAVAAYLILPRFSRTYGPRVGVDVPPARLEGLRTLRGRGQLLARADLAGDA